MKYLWIVVLACSVSPVFGEQSKTWTALNIYSDGRIQMQEGITSETTCRQVLCFVKDGMSCEAKVIADVAAREATKQREAEREQKIAEYRLTHPCKITQDEGYERNSSGSMIPDGKGSFKTTKVPQLHCPLPDGGERVYDEGGKQIIGTSGSVVVTSGAWVIGTSLKTQACFQ